MLLWLKKNHIFFVRHLTRNYLKKFRKFWCLAKLMLLPEPESKRLLVIQKLKPLNLKMARNYRWMQ